MSLRIGVEQQLIRIEAVPLLRLVGTVHAEPVNSAWRHSGQITMPYFVGVLRLIDPRRLALAAIVVETNLDAAGMRREQREIDAFPVPGGAQRVRQPFPGLDLVD